MVVQHPFHFHSQFLAVLFGQRQASIGAPARMRIRVRAAANGNQRERTWEVVLNRLLCVTRPIAAHLVEITSQRCAMAGVTGQHRAHFPVPARNA